MESLLATSIALLAGLLMTRVFKLIHLHFPDVTAFLLAGLLVGPYCLGRLGIPGLGFASMKAVDSLSVLSNTVSISISTDLSASLDLISLRSEEVLSVTAVILLTLSLSQSSPLLQPLRWARSPQLLHPRPL